MHFLTLPSGQQLAHCFAHFRCSGLVCFVHDSRLTVCDKKQFKLFFRGVDDASVVKGGSNIVMRWNWFRHNVQSKWRAACGMSKRLQGAV